MYYLKNAIKTILDFIVIMDRLLRGPQLEQVKKSIQKLFKEHGLEIIIQCNIKNVN